MTEDKDDPYFRELWARRLEAQVPPFRQVLCAGEAPELGSCHRNCRIFERENAGFKRVVGWLDETCASRLTAHSLVEDEHGALFEITREHPYRFIRHVGDRSVFDDISARHPGRPYRILD